MSLPVALHGELEAALVADEGLDWASYAGRQKDGVEAVISQVCDAFGAATSDALADWQNTATENTADINGAISERLAEMDQVIANKKDVINQMIETITDDFIIIFWDTIEEIYSKVDYYERQGLIWKALYQKD